MRKILNFSNFRINEEKSEQKLFDLDNPLAYQTIKDLRSARIDGKGYVFLCVGSGMNAYASDIAKNDRDLGEILDAIALNKDKVLVFSLDGIYVISEAVYNGIIALATSIFPYIKEGSVEIDPSVYSNLEKINVYYEEKGKDPFFDLQKKPAGFFKKIINDLYSLAMDSPKASEALSVLVVGAYKASTSSFKTIKDFERRCIYEPAEDLEITTLNLGRDVEDLYKVAQNTLNNLEFPISRKIEKGGEELSEIMDKEVKYTKRIAKTINQDAAEYLIKTQERIAPNGEFVISKNKPVWDYVFNETRKN
jgi:hypothetical protein